VLRRIYEPLTAGTYYDQPGSLPGNCSMAHPAPIVVTSAQSAEIIKHASNAFLALKISFINAVANLAEAVDADIEDIAQGMGLDTRIGPKFLRAGLGYGGSCFPKDVQALTMLGKKHGVPMRLAEATDLANREQADFLAGLVEEALGGCDGKKIAFWGLAFKPETDDTRESPSLKLAEALLEKGASIVGHDPEAGPNFSKMLQDNPHHARFRVVDREYDAVDDADAVVLLTEWRSYRAPDFVEIARRMRGKVALDARNVWRPADVVNAGLQYRGIGVPSHDPRS
jgi:UDPglucose 6-dehydrogenase